MWKYIVAEFFDISNLIISLGFGLSVWSGIKIGRFEVEKKYQDMCDSCSVTDNMCKNCYYKKCVENESEGFPPT